MQSSSSPISNGNGFGGWRRCCWCVGFAVEDAGGAPDRVVAFGPAIPNAWWSASNGPGIDTLGKTNTGPSVGPKIIK